ncbi:diguanylate cyclase [Shewanella sp. NFH-SH190041]|uniref:sensor domain-containing diguanylate cyclase n=1 Tax=Shewanella sp. NFH-SH190041 TaxID=2950245 RepID=UPI0021C3AFC7|nr:GGDEF domain-containing protein [Shewanella sp. NFH-SH190041]BDM63005.1 diguanylate cyclase [Shewanella sp. NFH-SH190041]
MSGQLTKGPQFPQYFTQHQRPEMSGVVAKLISPWQPSGIPDSASPLGSLDSFVTGGRNNTDASEQVAPLPLAAANQAPIATAQLLGVMMQMQHAQVLVDDCGLVLGVNSAAAALLQDTGDSFVGERWQTWLPPAAQAEYGQMFIGDGPQRQPQQHGPREMIIRQACGGLLLVNMSLSFIDGLFMITLQDHSQYQAELQRLTQQAATDYLTGLANRRAFDEMLERSWHQCIRRSQPISVIIIDVDFFKTFNDMFGHLQGDDCLKRISRIISSMLPSPQCLAARYGGEEFALVLPGFDADTAEEVAQSIRRQVNSMDFAHAGLPEITRVSVSQGIATEYRGEFRTHDALMYCADTALYRAKTEGRDRISHCSC